MDTKGKRFEASSRSMVGIVTSGHKCTHLPLYAKRPWGHGGSPHAQSTDSKKAVKKEIFFIDCAIFNNWLVFKPAFK